MADLREPAGKPAVGRILLGLGVSALFIALAVYRVDFGKLWATFRQSQPLWLIAAVACILLSYGFRGLMWRQLLARQSAASAWELTRVLVIGYFANNVLPLKLGEVVRVWLLAQRAKLRGSGAIAMVVVERGLDLLSLLVNFTVLMFFMHYAPWLKLSGLVIAGLALMFFLFLVLNSVFGGTFLAAVERPLSRWPGTLGPWLHTQLENLSGGLKLIHGPGHFLTVAGLSLLTWFAWMAVAYFCFLAAHLALPLSAAVFLIVVLNLGLIIPSSPGGLGVFEFMVILSLAPFGVNKESALGVGFMFHMLIFLVTFVLGWLFLVQFNLSFASLWPASKTKPPTSPA